MAEKAAKMGMTPEQLAALPEEEQVVLTDRASDGSVISERFFGADPSGRPYSAEVGGAGTIYGTTKAKGTPNTPTKARVVLLHQRSKLPVRETWSDPTTGYFEFRGIDVNQQFLTLAEDAEGHFRPVAANRLTPEVLA